MNKLLWHQAVFLLVVAGCGNPGSYERSTEFELFLSTETSLSLRQSPQYFLVIPLGGCSDCVDQALQALSIDNSDKLKGIILAQNNRELTLSRQSSIQLNSIINRNIAHVLADGRHLNYDLGIYGPTLIIYKNGDWNKQELEAVNIKEQLELVGVSL